MADAVAQQRLVAVTGVLPPGNSQRSQPINQLRVCKRQQWAHKRRSAGAHSRQSVGTGAAQQTKEKGFSLIIKMMTKGDQFAPVLRCRLKEKRAAGIPGHLLQTAAAGCNQCRHINARGNQGDIESGTQSADKSRIFSALRTQRMVKMSSNNTQTELRGEKSQQVQQRNRIRPAGNGDEDRATGREKMQSGGMTPEFIH